MEKFKKIMGQIGGWIALHPLITGGLVVFILGAITAKIIF